MATPRDEDMQNPLVHEGAEAQPGTEEQSPSDSNEGADDRVAIVEPSGELSPRATETASNDPKEES